MTETTETKIVDRKLAWELIDKLVAERGRDYVYVWPDEFGCFYVHDGVPSCAVGQMVYYTVPLPETVEFLERMDRYPDDTVWSSRVEDFEDCLGVEFDSDARSMFGAFQAQQDSGWDYGRIVDKLEKDFPRDR